MSISIVNICYLYTGCLLVKDKRSETPIFCLRVFENNQWVTINEWDDPGHVANLLVKSGYESEHLPAIKLLNVL